MYKLEITDCAEEDLDKILEYIAENLANPEAAAAFANAVDDCYNRLEENPYSFEECRNLKLQKEGYRRAVIKNYIMLYKIYGDQVIVHRFFYGRRDYSNLV